MYGCQSDLIIPVEQNQIMLFFFFWIFKKASTDTPGFKDDAKEAAKKLIKSGVSWFS